MRGELGRRAVGPLGGLRARGLEEDEKGGESPGFILAVWRQGVEGFLHAAARDEGVREAADREVAGPDRSGRAR